MERGKIVVCAIHKGGAGKTTIAVNLTHFAHKKGLKTLLVDLDPQGNASDAFIDDLETGVEQASRLFDDVKPKQIQYVKNGLGIIPSDGAPLQDVESSHAIDSALVFRKRLQEIAKDFDLVIVDTPPTMGFCMLAPLIAADYAFSPIVPDAYSGKGIHSLIERVAQVRAQLNPELQYLGLLINLWNKRGKHQNAKVEEYQAELGDYLIPYAIGLRAPIADAAQVNKPVWEYTRGVAAKEIKDALGWIIEQMRLEEKIAA